LLGSISVGSIMFPGVVMGVIKYVLAFHLLLHFFFSFPLCFCSWTLVGWSVRVKKQSFGWLVTLVMLQVPSVSGEEFVSLLH